MTHPITIPMTCTSAVEAAAELIQMCLDDHAIVVTQMGKPLQALIAPTVLRLDAEYLAHGPDPAGRERLARVILADVWRGLEAGELVASSVVTDWVAEAVRRFVPDYRSQPHHLLLPHQVALLCQFGGAAAEEALMDDAARRLHIFDLAPTDALVDSTDGRPPRRLN